MKTFNCYACHSRDKVGGPEEKINPLFLTAQPEMGDEGRVPPPLDGVGNKLNPDYFTPRSSTMVRTIGPTCSRACPASARRTSAIWSRQFAKADKIPPAPGGQVHDHHGEGESRRPTPGRRPGVRLHQVPHVRRPQGRGRAGDRHDAPAQAPAARLVPTLFARPAKGAARHAHAGLVARWREPFYKDLLGGDTTAQIEAIWVYLKDGTNAQTADRLRPAFDSAGARQEGRSSIATSSRAPGRAASPSAIRRRRSLAFDANDLRLAMIWQGAFIDAGPALDRPRRRLRRSPGRQHPSTSRRRAIRRARGCEAPWPSDSAKQLGYQVPRLSPDAGRSPDVPVFVP